MHKTFLLSLVALLWIGTNFNQFDASAQSVGVYREVYTNITGVNVSDLTNSAKFPNSPDQTGYLTNAFEAPIDIMDNYGQRCRALITAPITGTYLFWISSDDASTLFLSTDENPNNKVAIAGVNSWTSSREWTKEANQQSAAIALTAGQRYFLEALMKEGGGGDNLAVRWQLPNATIEEPIPASRMTPFTGVPTSPPLITAQPTNTTIVEGDTVTFRVACNNFDPLVYQWQRNSNNIAGATNSTFTIITAALTNNGAFFRCIITNVLGATSSANALLTVLPDTTSPTMSLVQNIGSNQVMVIFSEAVEAASGTNRLNYSISNGITVSAAAFGPDAKTILLTTSPLTFGSNYTLYVSSVRDRAATPNSVAPNSAYAFVATAYAPQDVGSPAQAGSTVIVSNGYDVTAGGSDVGGGTDQFHFDYQQRTGDFDMKVRVQGIGLSDVWAKAGLMARETLNANSRFAASMATPNLSGTFFEYRDPAGGNALTAGTFPVNGLNTWLRLQRVGNQFTGYAGYDGQTWAQLGSAVIAMSNTVYFGMAVTSHSTNQPTIAQFRDLATASGAIIGTPTTGAEPLGPSSRRTSLVFSEIMYHPAPRLDGKNLEYIEIFNSNPYSDDIGGYRISGDVDFTFPTGTVIPGGGFLVVAKVPADVQSVYGLTGVLGPYTNSLHKSSTLRLRNNTDAIYLEVTYNNKLPWPVGADGTGHSLVLAKPSYGEADPRAWSISDAVGGSPGSMETFRPAPQRNVLINEFLAHTDIGSGLLDFIELYNHSTQAVDISGCYLSDDPGTNKFRIPDGTILPPRGFAWFDEAQLGFGMSASGESIFLVNSNQTRVLDAVSFEGQANGVSTGRSPDGANDFYPLATRTPGTNNSAILIRDIVINEIMYAPITGDSSDTYVEIYNKGPSATDLTGWKFTHGINFDFPSNTVLAAGGYLVVAKNLTNLFAHYPSLNANNTLGNFSGQLSKSGERLALSMPQNVISTNSSGALKTNSIDVLVDEVTYGIGGRWGTWAKEGGSSLELIDPRANHRLPSNWGDSDETAKAAWTTIGVTNGLLDLGATYNGTPIDRLEIVLPGAGECLLDNVEVINPLGVSSLANTNFESGLSPWTQQGDHIQSFLENTAGFGGGKCLHIKATDRGDTGANRIRVALTNALTAGQTATIRAKVRWLRGWPEIVMRVKGNYLEAAGRLSVPYNLGTPGAPNSRAVANAGPAIYEVAHSPVAPAASQPVVVTARVHDPDGVSAVTLKYRVDPATTYSTLTMVDNGAGGDAVAGDGIFSGTIPGQTSGTLVAFYVQAGDNFSPPATNYFPNDAPVRECLVRFGDPGAASSFGIYRLWLTQNNINTWINRPSLSNERIEGTFAYGNVRAIYNVGSKYAGSPYHQGFGSPLGDCHFSMEMPGDDLLLGTDNFNKIHEPGNGPGDDNTIQREQTAYWMARQIGVPWNYRRYVALFVNGARKGTFMEDTQTPGGEILNEHFPDDSNGDLYKLQPWFEFDDVTVTGGNGAGFNNQSWCTLNNFTSGGVKRVARYRPNYLKRAVTGSASDYTNVFNLVDAANTSVASGWSNHTANMLALVDMENWLRTFAIEHAVGNWDSFGNVNAQNMYGYKPERGKWTLFIWDYNIVLNNSGTGTGSDGPTGDDLFKYQGADNVMGNIYNNPTFRRAYWRAFYDIVNGPMNNANADPLLDAKYNAFLANGQTSITSPASIKSFISARRSYIQSQLNTVAAPFSAGNTFTTNNNLAMISGTAPVGVKTIKVNGIAYSPTWTTVTGWTMPVPVGFGANLLVFQGYDTYGNPIGGASSTIYVTNTGPVALPQGNVVINEIMYHPAVANAEFVELFNAHPNVTFDLSRWRLDGADFTFPEGTFVRPGQFLVVAKDAFTFAATYGSSIPTVGEFSGNLQNNGETLKLVIPGAGANPDQIVDEVRYDSVLPWAMAADGSGPSLQLIDPAQDNYRVGNWSAVPTNLPGPYYTPGATNSLRASLAAFPLVWLNEVQVFNTNGITDNFAEREPWIELYNNGPTAINLNGLFLTDNYSNLTQWPFPPGASIAAGQFMLVWADGQSNQTAGTNYHTSFRLTNSFGSLALVRTNAGRTNVLDYFNYYGQTPNRSFGSYPDGQPKTRQIFQFATPGGTNNPAFSPAPAVVNEWMADNSGPNGFPDPADGLFQDWFELYNPNTNAVDLSGYFLTDTLSQPRKFTVPVNTVIPPLGFLLVWADNNTAQNGTGTNGDLHANFQLSNSGEAIGLFAPDGTAQSTVTFGAQIQNVSQGRWPDGNTSGPVYFMTNFTPRAANVLAVINHSPSLASIGNKTGNELSPISFTAAASDPDTGQTLTFTLDPGAPAGAAINPASGAFTWTPTEAQGPGTYSVTVRVTDNGAPNLSASETFMITVSEVNAVPVLAVIGNQTVNEGSTLTFTAAATDSDLPANTLSYSLDPGAPAGASINPNTGVFSWTPTETQGPAVYSITVRVTDNGSPPLSDTKTFSVTVNEVNSAPVLGALINRTLNEGTLLTFTATATDADLPANTLIFSLDPGAPAGATINASSGVFNWTPGEAQGPATNSITVRVTDNGSPPLSDAKTFVVVVSEVNLAPVLTTIANRTINEGVLLSFTNSATDPDIPANILTYSLDPGAPVGATINPATGVFTWTPDETQGGTTNTITVRVTDNGTAPLSDTKTFIITVNEVNSPPVLTSISDRSVNEGSLLTFTNSATDPDLPVNTITFSIDPGAPAGTSINATNGVFSWTPDETQGGTTNLITIRATDNGSPPLSDAKTFKVVVNEVNSPPVLAVISDKNINEGSLLSFTAIVTDPDIPANTLTFSLEPGAPSGAAIHPASGVFSWTPTEAQGPSTNAITVRVTDNGSPTLSDTRSFTVVVNEVNSAPVLGAIGNKNAIEGLQLSFTATATDSDLPAQTLTFSLDPGAPSGAAINPASGVFTWTPSAAQTPSTNAVTVRVTDNSSPPLNDSQTFTIFVAATNSAPVLAVITNRVVNEGTALVITNTATDTDVPAQALTFSLDPGAPAGASINPTNGILTWTPTEAQGPSTNSITVRVTDSASPPLSDAKTFLVVVAEVNVSPTLAAITNYTVNEGTLLTFTNSATDADLPANQLTFTLDAGAPAGALVHPTTGVFTWTPDETQGGTTNVITVRVTDNGSPALNDSKTFTVIVQEVNSAPTLSPIPDRTVNEQTLVTFNASANDGDIPAQTLTFTLDAGAPSGASINPTTGVFTWTPTEAQGPSTNIITVRVTDSGSPLMSDAKTFTIIVNEVNTAPGLTVPGNQTINELATLTVTNLATDADLPANTLNFALVSGPGGVSLNASSGVLTWTPTEAQGPSTNTISVRVFDNGTPSLSVTQSFAVIVNEVNAAPVLTPIGNKSVAQGGTVTFTATATDSDVPTNTLTFSLDSGAPSGATIHPQSGVFTWTDNVGPGAYPVVVRVTDNGQPPLSSSEALVINVLGTNIPVQLFGLTNNWKYNQSGSDLGTSWQGPGYDDSAWSNGPALLYVEDAALPAPKNTLLSLTNAAGQHIITYYFRTHFFLPSDPAGVVLTSSNLIDDGAIFYLNGVEAARYNMPAGAAPYTALSSTVIGDATTWIVTNLTTTGLVAGDNVLAVEVHQGSSTSSDIVLGTTLTAVFPSQSPILITNQPTNVTVLAGSPAQFTVGASGSFPRYQWFKNNTPIAGANSATYTLASAQISDAGTYTVLVSNLITSVTSSGAVLTVTNPPNTPPVLATVNNKTVNELSSLTFTATATDNDSPAQTFSWTLDPGAPAGAAINPTTGAFSWTPTETQGPGIYAITIRVTDNGSPALSDAVTFSVTVNEVNSAPTLASISNKTVTEGSTLAFNLSASDADIPPNAVSFALVAAPPGVNLDSASGAFTWTPTEAQGPSTNLIVVQAFDNGSPSLAATQTFTVFVTEVNSAPVLATIPNKTIAEGNELTFTASATDADLPANTLTFSLDANAPLGASIHPTSGVFRWTPTEAQGPSTNQVTIRVTDSGSPPLSDTVTFSIIVSEVNAAPVLANISDKIVNEGTLLTFSATATDSDLPANQLTFSLDAGAPSGASIHPANGTFTWTPTEAQGPSTNLVTIRVTDNGTPPLSATQTFTITVNEVNSPPTLTGIGSKTVNEGTLLTFTATASDVDLPAQRLSFSLDPGAPTGASINPTTGVFTWTPTETQAPSTNLVTIRVTDDAAAPLSDSETITIIVSEVNSQPVLGAIGNKTVNEGTLLTFTATATDPDIPAQQLTFSLDSGAPAGANIHPTTGVFSWTPTEAQGPSTNLVTIRVTDDGSPTATASETFTIVVNEVNSAPVLAAIGDKLVDEGTLLTFTVTATDPDLPNQALSFSLLAGAPQGAAITSDGHFSWTPSEAQGPSTNLITFVVTDGSLSNSQAITIVVREVNSAPKLASIGDKTVNEGSTLTFTATATDSDLPAQSLTFSLDPGAPAGASIGASNGIFAWTPTEAQGPGTNTITIRITDNGSPALSAAETFTVIVAEINSPPSLTPIGPKTVDEGSLLTFTNSAADPDIPTQTLTWSLDPGAPIGAQINPTNGVFTWTPGETQGGTTNAVTVRVTDDGSPPSSTAETISIVVRKVNSPPLLTPIGNKFVSEGGFLSFYLSAADSDLPQQQLTFSMDPGAPAGTSLNPLTGEFSWSPTEAQGPSTNLITFRVTDDGTPPLSDTRTITIIVNEVNSAPSLAGISPQAINESALLTFSVAATDSDLPAQRLIFSLDAGAPTGASITPDGLFSWTPGEDQGPGTYAVTIRVTDNGVPPLSDAQTVVITVNEVNTAPVLAVIGDKSLTAGEELFLTATATDSDLPAQTLVYSLDSGAPAGASINPTSGLLHWKTPVGLSTTTNEFTVRATDSGSPALSDSKTFRVVVTPLQILSIRSSEGVTTLAWQSRPGKAYQVQYTASLAEGDWTNLGTPITATQATTLVNDTAATEQQRFYRVLQTD